MGLGSCPSEACHVFWSSVERAGGVEKKHMSLLLYREVWQASITSWLFAASEPALGQYYYGTRCYGRRNES